jgi:hypothetical protein
MNVRVYKYFFCSASELRRIYQHLEIFSNSPFTKKKQCNKSKLEKCPSQPQFSPVQEDEGYYWSGAVFCSRYIDKATAWTVQLSNLARAKMFLFGRKTSRPALKANQASYSKGTEVLYRE